MLGFVPAADIITRHIAGVFFRRFTLSRP